MCILWVLRLWHRNQVFRACELAVSAILEHLVDWDVHYFGKYIRKNIGSYLGRGCQILARQIKLILIEIWGGSSLTP